jgi:hypothetical protein
MGLTSRSSADTAELGHLKKLRSLVTQIYDALCG